MNTVRIRLVALATLLAVCAPGVTTAQSQLQVSNDQSQPAPTPTTPMTQDQLDQLLAPIALYPDALVIQILQCAQSPFQVNAVSDWLTKNPDLKGTAAQDAAKQQGFDASFIAIVIFPDVVHMLANKPDWTHNLGQAFNTDKDAVLDSVQRLRKEAQNVGNLQSNQQQTVQTVNADGGGQVIVIQPANPQVVYVPQYNPQTVYTQPATYAQPATTSDDDSRTVAAGLIGFAAGVIVGAAADNDDDHYYYAYGGWGYGHPLCYPGGYNDFYAHRERMANDYYDHRQNMVAQRGDNIAGRQDVRTDARSTRQDTRVGAQSDREDARSQAQSTRQTNRIDAQSTRQSDRIGAQGAAQSTRGVFDAGAQSRARPAQQSAGAFSGYQRGSMARESSSRGYSSLSRGGGAAFSRGGGRSFGGRR